MIGNCLFGWKITEGLNMNRETAIEFDYDLNTKKACIIVVLVISSSDQKISGKKICHDSVVKLLKESNL
jgi:hypothetical protein